MDYGIYRERRVTRRWDGNHSTNGATMNTVPRRLFLDCSSMSLFFSLMRPVYH